MNSDELGAMIDTILMGKSWTMLIQDATGDELLGVHVVQSGVIFELGADHRVRIGSRIYALEIAQALQAWAATQDKD